MSNSIVWEYILNYLKCDGSTDFTLTSEQIKESGKQNKTLKCAVLRKYADDMHMRSLESG